MLPQCSPDGPEGPIGEPAPLVDTPSLVEALQGPTGNVPPTAARKADHLRINLEQDVQANGIDAGFERYRFVHHALPDLDLAAVDTTVTVFGRSLRAPLLISCMTGGTPEAGRINATLAQVAEALGLAMGLGSGRVLLERPETMESFAVRRHAPHALLFANLGAVQLNRGVDVDDCRRLVERLGADALVLHLNPLQEALQPDGDTNFAGLLPRIDALCVQLQWPVVVKEVGWGLDADLVRALFDAGVAAVDVAGAGGTSWSEVERHRLHPPWRARVAGAFIGWGIPTTEALRAARRAAGSGLVFASGGVRTGLDAAKALALGADLVGMAGPFLRAAAAGGEAARELGDELVATLRTAMFCVGARTLADLRHTRRLRDMSLPRLVAEVLHYTTAAAPSLLDITDDVQAVVARSGVWDGQVHVFTHHTTLALRINEAEPGLLSDITCLLERLVPTGGYVHDDLTRRPGVPPDEPINGHAHCRQLLLGSSETIPVADGRLALGPWQRVLLIELCSPRARALTVQVLGC